MIWVLSYEFHDMRSFEVKIAKLNGQVVAFYSKLGKTPEIFRENFILSDRLAFHYKI